MSWLKEEILKRTTGQNFKISMLSKHSTMSGAGNMARHEYTNLNTDLTELTSVETLFLNSAGVWRGCLLSPVLFSIYPGNIMLETPQFLHIHLYQRTAVLQSYRQSWKQRSRILGSHQHCEKYKRNGSNCSEKKLLNINKKGTLRTVRDSKRWATPNTRAPPKIAA